MNRKVKYDPKEEEREGEPRREALIRHLVEKGIQIDEDHTPYRTMVRTKYHIYNFAVIGDSIVYGIFLDGT